VAVCDVDKSRVEAAKQRVEKANGRPCAAYGDYRKLLEDKSIDAVLISTPDHWHALPAIHACEAGKDVYCEKPLTLFITEGQALVAAVRRNQRVFQTGSQQRSDAKFRKACEYARSGRLGKIKSIKVGLPQGSFHLGQADTFNNVWAFLRYEPPVQEGVPEKLVSRRPGLGHWPPGSGARKWAPNQAEPARALGG
jgi:predicted dehydrogenase